MHTETNRADGAATGTGRWWLAPPLAVLSLAAASLAAAAGPSDPGSPPPPQVLRPVEISPPTLPYVFDGDLRNLPRAPEWQPGDAIKEIPRRHHHPPALPETGRGAEQIDPLLQIQESLGLAGPRRDISPPLLNFNGQGFTGVTPPDTVGDVGPNHYIQAVNHSSGTSFTIYNKSGGVLVGATILDTLGTGNCASGLGDPVVLYDPLADRWLLSEFSNSGNRLCVYVSQTADPVSGGWFNYDFTATNFPDYPKYAVWPDAYYVSSNESSPAAYALQRSQMLNGLAATFQRFTVPDLAGFGFQALTPSDVDGATAPPVGAPGYFLRHRDDEVHNPPGDPTRDFLEIWELKVNFANPLLSTMTGPTNIPVAEFSSDLCGLVSFSCFPQPAGPALDPLREVVMWRSQYRNSAGNETLVGNYVTDVTGTDRGGVRWYEMRKSGAGPWTLFQEGTYSPDATNRFMGSAAMDGSGGIVVGYNVTSSSVNPGLRYAGRLATDPPGTLPQGEFTLIAGTASNGSNRYGDYSSLNLDPADDCTFWLTGEYNTSSSWSTRIGSFRFTSCGTCVPTQNPETSCADGIDNDCDGLTDLADPDCACVPTQNPETSCADGIDNDCDGLTDLADPDCACVPTQNPETSCADGIDNDCDGLTDLADPDCAPPPLTAFRINCGGSDYTDVNGKLFVADKAFIPGNFGYVGGGAASFTSPVSGTSDDLLFQTMRGGANFDYLFDGLAAGSYDITFYFNEPFVNSAGARKFDVSVEGLVVLDDLDIFAEVGKNAALIKNVTASVGDGQLKIDFDKVVGSNAIVSAIAVVAAVPPPLAPDIAVTPASLAFGNVVVNSTSDLSVSVSNTGTTSLTVTSLTTTNSKFTVVSPSTPFTIAAGGPAVSVVVRFAPTAPGAQSGDLTIASNDPDENPTLVALSGTGVSTPAFEFRIECGGSNYTDTQGKLWVADKTYTPGSYGAVGGTSQNFPSPVANTIDDLLYQTVRGATSFDYLFDNTGNGTFQVTFHFNEPFFNSPGARVFNVKAEGLTVLTNFDIFAQAGARLTALTRTVTTVVSDGQLSIDFDKVSGGVAIVSGIEIIQLP